MGSRVSTCLAHREHPPGHNVHRKLAALDQLVLAQRRHVRAARGDGSGSDHDDGDRDHRAGARRGPRPVNERAGAAPFVVVQLKLGDLEQRDALFRDLRSGVPDLKLKERRGVTFLEGRRRFAA